MKPYLGYRPHHDTNPKVLSATGPSVSCLAMI